jgi:hypothetical protein
VLRKSFLLPPPPANAQMIVFIENSAAMLPCWCCTQRHSFYPYLYASITVHALTLTLTLNRSALHPIRSKDEGANKLPLGFERAEGMYLYMLSAVPPYSSSVVPKTTLRIAFFSSGPHAAPQAKHADPSNFHV